MRNITLIIKISGLFATTFYQQRMWKIDYREITHVGPVSGYRIKCGMTGYGQALMDAGSSPA